MLTLWGMVTRGTRDAGVRGPEEAIRPPHRDRAADQRRRTVHERDRPARHAHARPSGLSDPTPRSGRGSPPPPSQGCGAPHRRSAGGHRASRSRRGEPASDAHAHPRSGAPGRRAHAPSRPPPHHRRGPSARAWSRRSRAAGPGRKARALPSPVQRQLDRQLLQRLREPIVLRLATIIGGTDRRPTSQNRSANISSGNSRWHSRCNSP